MYINTKQISRRNSLFDIVPVKKEKKEEEEGKEEEEEEKAHKARIHWYRRSFSLISQYHIF